MVTRKSICFFFFFKLLWKTVGKIETFHSNGDRKILKFGVVLTEQSKKNKFRIVSLIYNSDSKSSFATLRIEKMCLYEYRKTILTQNNAKLI